MPDQTTIEAGRVMVVEGASDSARRLLFQEILISPQNLPVKSWLLSCDFRDHGLWAGVKDLFENLLPDIKAKSPELIRAHDYELVHVIPALKRVLDIRNPTLTDIASPQERVRNYPADRALRMVHGLIDLLDKWKRQERGGESWVIVCDSFDSAGHMVRSFFRELMRRRGKELRIALVATVGAGKGQEVLEQFDSRSRGIVVRANLALEETSVQTIDPAAAEQIAQHLEQELKSDAGKIEIYLSELIRTWRIAGRPDKVAHWELLALDLYDLQGFYEEAAVYGESARRYFKSSDPGNWRLRWALFSKLFMCYLALDRPEAAYRLVTDENLEDRIEPRKQSTLHYYLSMLHSRYLPARDLARGEEHLERGLEALARADIPEELFHFQSVFNRNGLAMIRHFQGRYQEAIDLCRKGFEELNTYLSPEKHRLHRSVLLFNLAQVYVVLGKHDEAVSHFTAAIEMDSNYSEYYNDRGSVLLKMGRLEEARSDYLSAIKLSPPYAEVYVNLGQCYRLMGQLDRAVGAYSTALDLDPARVLALAGRGQCHEAEGRVREAIEDYSAALALSPNQWDILANRAVLLYEQGTLEASLADLNQAIALAPHVAVLYQNRAVALADEGRLAEAARDLETYLTLSPDAEDRPAVEARLRQFYPIRNAPAVV